MNTNETPNATVTAVASSVGLGDTKLDEASDTNKPWSQQICERIAELERKVELGGELAATIVINVKRGTIRSDDDELLLALANRLLDGCAKATAITKSPNAKLTDAAQERKDGNDN